MKFTIRVRLTILYGSLFFVAGLVLVGATYLLVANRLNAVELTVKPDNIPTVKTTTPVTVTEIEALVNEKMKLREAYMTAQAEYKAETLNTVLTQSSVALGGVGVIAVWLGWIIAGRALRPLKQITETARRVAGRSLHERIGLSGPRDELRELGDTFDEMLERLDRSFDGQRRFVGNASHELRTPLAINRTLLEVALNRPDACGQVRQLGQTLLEVNARNEKLIDGLLTLARSEETIVATEPVDLSVVTGHVLEQHPDPRIEPRVQEAPTVGDPVMLERLAHNLIENALRYNEPDGWVTVSTRTQDGTARLTVTNTGPVVPAYEIPRLFEPFRRLSDRVGSARGAGLGLSIVRSVAHAHGGAVKAEPRPGGGLIVEVTLPAMDQL
ncbi:MAG TPA: HAMP domain-containing sensor histidine kinase [Candidatus Limnocylindrales bacterium]